MRAILEGYKEGFNSIGSLVDVGGGTGGVLAEIVRSYPHIEGINFDLPHVVATTPACNGVTHFGGDMFDTIPCADTVFIKVSYIAKYFILIYYYVKFCNFPVTHDRVHLFIYALLM